MQISKEEHAQLNAAAIKALKKYKHHTWLTPADIISEVVIKYPYAPVSVWILKIPETLGKIQTIERTANMGEDKLFNKKLFSKNWLINEKATNPAYLDKHRKRNNLWDKTQRLLKTQWSIARNASQRTRTYLYNLIRYSLSPQPCPLSKGKCIRLSYKRHFFKGHTCPLTNKFKLHLGMCHPLKPQQ